MGAGAHQMYAFYATNATSGAVGACPSGGLTFAPFTFSSELSQDQLAYPATIGATIPQTNGFQLMVHYMNTGTTVVQSSVALTMYIANPAVVTTHAGVLFLSNSTLTVPASCGSGCQASSTFTLPQNVNILSSVSVMTRYGTHFVAVASTGPTLYQTNNWAQPAPQVYSTPLALASGTSITWTCTNVNPTGSTLTFGESANTNVQCTSMSTFYPASNVTNPVISSP